MKKRFVWALCFLGGCASFTGADGQAHYKMQTQRQEPYYLSIEAEKVQDTCPAHDILKQFSCTKEQTDGYSCFDVYMVQGRPANEQEYTLLQEKVQSQPVTAQPPCPADMQPTCASFLKALKYNLEFSWYLVDFPSSSFAQCKETYDCKRIDCAMPSQTPEQAAVVSCVYKRNQVFFVGSEITCRQTPR